jgi:choline monooxygenase
MSATAITIEGFLGEGAIRSLGEPVERGTTLPNRAYLSEEFFRLECARLFARTWVLAGFGQQVPDPGDALPLTIAGQPIVLVRGHDRVVRAFHNVCLHRGTTVVAAPCRKAAVLTCPYHGWAYGLEGKVRTQPHYFGVDRHRVLGNGGDGPGLAPVRMAMWHDWIFVNIDGRAQPLEAHLAPMIRNLDGYDVSGAVYGGALTFDIRGNWKLVHENFIDIYHKPSLHPRLCEAAPLSANYPTTWEGACFTMSHKLLDPQEGRGLGLPRLPNLSEKRAREGLFYHLFPTIDVGFWPDQIVVIDVQPTAVDRCHETMHFFFAPEAMAPEHERLRGEVMRAWTELNNEDIGIVERMQIGRNSAGFDGGVLVPTWDGPIQRLCQLVVETMR